MIYLSCPYSSSDPAELSIRVDLARKIMASFIEQGHLVVCPIAMNHEAMAYIARGSSPKMDYWRRLEIWLADTCDELVVITAAGWKQSRGVAREIVLFEERGKPVRAIDPDGRLHPCGPSESHET